MKKILILFLSIVTLGLAKISPYGMGVKKTQGKIEILDTKRVELDQFDGFAIKELSGLAYKNGILYAVGDKGILCHFHLELHDDKIKELSLEKVFELKSKKGNKLKKSKTDSEGLVFMGEDLLISFERDHRVDLYSKDGIKIKGKKIHKHLQEHKKYQSKNKGLEAVAYNQKYGIVTAPEQSLKNEDDKKHIIYGEKRVWSFPSHGSVTALEFIAEDKLMILQRSVNFLAQKLEITLSLLDLRNEHYELLAKFDTKDDWRLDNFEGLTKVGENRYLMISDNNGKFFQKTLVVLFKIN